MGHLMTALGARVERVIIQLGADGPPDHVLRVSWRGYWQADCSTTEEVARHVELATLVPEGWAHVRPLIRPSIGGPSAPTARQGRPGTTGCRRPGSAAGGGATSAPNGSIQRTWPVTGFTSALRQV
jgi:hypothetical protein